MSYRLKLAVTISLLIAIAFGIGGTLMITTSFQASLDKETQAALDSFESVQNTLYLLNSLGDQTDYESLTNALQQMESQHMGGWQALSLKAVGESLYRSGTMSDKALDMPVPAADQCTYTSVTDSYGHGLVVMSMIQAGDAALELMGRFDLSDVYELRQTQQRQYLMVYAAVVLFGVLASAVLAVMLTRPLRHLTATVRKISGGDLSRRSKLTTHDEFGQLSRDFDVMADKLQENISRLESEMQRQENFMGAFAHELKTPMTSIIGFADLLRQDSLDESTRMMAAEYIFSEGRRLERLSFKLLDLLLLQKDGMKPKTVWLGSFVSEVERAMAPVMEKKHIRLLCKAQQTKVAFEPDLVKSLLYNLVDNAAKAMDHGGTITVQAASIPGGCEFRVMDQGRGMERAELAKITEAFYRVDKARSRSQGGAGLGLSLCRQIAELHNGHIGFESEPGRGTTVTVTLYAKAVKRDG
ncbi:MAG: HAMP domain-containing histidine kinase [Oscillospiraceae bacterium]|nr:HAMP domain-containing histidine kinase [Oscillospiraceae bacterium]